MVTNKFNIFLELLKYDHPSRLPLNLAISLNFHKSGNPSRLPINLAISHNCHKSDNLSRLPKITILNYIFLIPPCKDYSFKIDEIIKYKLQNKFLKNSKKDVRHLFIAWDNPTSFVCYPPPETSLELTRFHTLNYI